MALTAPYLLFLGDAADPLAAKVAQGIQQWRPEKVVGQFSLPGCKADLGLEELSIAEARARGAQTLVVGVANRGGVISESWLAVLKEALEAGMDLAAGLHNRLSDAPVLAETAARLGKRLHDVRAPQGPFAVGDGAKRPGKRLLPVGTDCSCGKMYTALALEAAMRGRGWPADFRATGQTGILIVGDGVPVDAVVADFIAGAIEALAPAAAEDHWDLIEGQGALHHPSFAGVTAGLIHGAQPDALVLCHEPTRTHMRGLPQYPLPSLEDAMALALEFARRTNPEARFVGLSINTAKLDEAAATELLAELAQRHGMPAVDPVRTGVEPLLDALA